MIADISTIKKKLEKTKASKNSPIYNSHIYWSQKAFNITDILIEELSDPGDVVFDPFMGSGVTVIESVSDRMKRNAIGVDINEVPVFIVDSLLKHRDLKKAKKLLADYVNEAHDKCDPFYKTLDDDGEEGISVSTVFDIVDGEFVLTRINGRCPKSRKKFSKKPSKFDRQALLGPYSVDTVEDLVLMEDTKLAVKKGQHISEIFTPRNFKVLDVLIGLSRTEKYREIYEELRYLLLSMIHLCKITDAHSNSQWPLWIPCKGCVEKNALEILDRRSQLTLKAFQHCTKHYKNCTRAASHGSFKGSSNYLLLRKGIQCVSQKDIPDGSVDLVITDPPYLGQVAYSEYMQLYEPFLGFAVNYDDEIVVSSAPSRKKTKTSYFELLDKAFEIVGSKLKNGHFFCMYFHDCSLNVWDRLISSLAKHGLRFLTQIHIGKSLTVKNIISPKKSMNGDALLFFVKESLVKSEVSGTESVADIEANVMSEAKHMIVEAGGFLSTPELYDNGLMEIIIHNGWLHPLAQKYKTLVDLFEKYLIWDGQNSKWHFEKPEQRRP